MEEYKKKIAIDKHIKTGVALLLVVFVFALYCTSQTSLVADDYAYLFDFSSGWGEPNPADIYPPPASCERIHHVLQIIPSMSAHRSCMNGRVLSHGLVQLFLMLPKTLFNVINALFFTLEIGLVAFIPALAQGQKGKRSFPLYLVFSFSCIWFFQLNFGEVNLWLDGAINYLWGSVLGLLYLGSYLTLFRDEYDFGCRSGRLAVPILSFIVGAYNESLGCTLIAFSFLSILYLRTVKNKKLSLSVYLSFLFTVAGFIFLLTAPATAANKIHSGSLQTALRNVLNTIPALVRTARRLSLLFAIVILLLAYGGIRRIQQDQIAVAVIILICAMICFFSLSLASRVPPRALFFVPVLLCLDCAWLLTCIFEREKEQHYAKICRGAIAILSCLIISFAVPKGVSDIHKVYILTKANEESISAARESGESVAVIQDIPREGLSGYAALEGLNYIDHSNPQSWPNVYMARYYGIAEIRASD